MSKAEELWFRVNCQLWRRPPGPELLSDVKQPTCRKQNSEHCPSYSIDPQKQRQFSSLPKLVLEAALLQSGQLSLLSSKVNELRYVIV